MSIFIHKDYTIELYRGDSGNLVFNGLPTDKNYTVFFAIKDPKTNEIILEISQDSQQQSSITFSLSAGQTNSLVIPGRNQTYTYNYGLKICDEAGTEDTLLPPVNVDENGDPVFASPTNVIVHQKYVEGIINEYN